MPYEALQNPSVHATTGPSLIGLLSEESWCKHGCGTPRYCNHRPYLGCGLGETMMAVYPLDQPHMQRGTWCWGRPSLREGHQLHGDGSKRRSGISSMRPRTRRPSNFLVTLFSAVLYKGRRPKLSSVTLIALQRSSTDLVDNDELAARFGLDSTKERIRLAQLVSGAQGSSNMQGFSSDSLSNSGSCTDSSRSSGPSCFNRHPGSEHQRRPYSRE